MINHYPINFYFDVVYVYKIINCIVALISLHIDYFFKAVFIKKTLIENSLPSCNCQIFILLTALM